MLNDQEHPISLVLGNNKISTGQIGILVFCELVVQEIKGMFFYFLVVLADRYRIKNLFKIDNKYALISHKSMVKFISRPVEKSRAENTSQCSRNKIKRK